jgi:acid phosphatase type 7
MNRRRAAVCSLLVALSGCALASSAATHAAAGRNRRLRPQPTVARVPARLALSATRTLAAVGDLVCPPGSATTQTQCRQQAVAQAIGEDRDVSGFLALGDLQYDNGELAGFRSEYAASYGKLAVPTFPAVGNHEYNTTDAAGYYAYFGKAAGTPGKGWYSLDLLPGWHLVVLNSNCSIVGCGSESEQVRWLQADLAQSTAVCTLAMWHHPRFSSGKEHGDTPETAVLWQTLHDAGADVVLAGHEHLYERFGPRGRNGEVVRSEPGGMRSFVVGTGGRSLYSFAKHQSASEATCV